jgi:hypothetical protein
MTAAAAVPATAVTIALYRIDHGELLASEPVTFASGARAVDTVLRRAAISGHVALGGELADHFADLLDAQGNMLANVALDRDSYAALKYKWMPCRLLAR